MPEDNIHIPLDVMLLVDILIHAGISVYPHWETVGDERKLKVYELLHQLELKSPSCVL